MSFVEELKRLKELADAAGRPEPPPEDEIDENAEVVAVLMRRREGFKGGEGSGHFDHPGRPGKVGGSEPTGRAPGEPKKSRPAVPKGPKPAPSKVGDGATRDHIGYALTERVDGNEMTGTRRAATLQQIEGWPLDRRSMALSAALARSKKPHWFFLVRSKGELVGIAACGIWEDHQVAGYFMATKRGGYGRYLMTQMLSDAKDGGLGFYGFATDLSLGFYKAIGIPTEKGGLKINLSKEGVQEWLETGTVGQKAADSEPSNGIFLVWPETEEKGGEGSGHFQHEGRPGEVGGSEASGRAPGDPSVRGPLAEGEPETQPELEASDIPDPRDEARDAAQVKLELAAEAEPALTGLVTGLAEERGGEMSGLENRFKSLESMSDKILRDMVKKQMEATDAAAQINDAVRYTSIFDPKTYSENILKIQEEMAAAGWTQHDNKWKNFWHPGGDYAGYHAVFTNPEGLTFEWQFHTPESIKVKAVSHEIYKKTRAMPDSPERTELIQRMEKLWEGLKEVPKGYENLTGARL